MLASANYRAAQSEKTDRISVNFSRLKAGSRRFLPIMSEWVAQRVAFGPSMRRRALPMPSALLRCTVLTSGAGMLQMHCAAPYRAISGCLSVTRERKSFWIVFLVNVGDIVENFEESLLFGEAKVVINTDLRFDVLHGLAVAAV